MYTNSPNWSLYILLKNVLREFDKRSRHFLFGDHFNNSHNLISWQCMDIVRRNLMLVTIGTWRVKEQFLRTPKYFVRLVNLLPLDRHEFDHQNMQIHKGSNQWESHCYWDIFSERKLIKHTKIDLASLKIKAINEYKFTWFESLQLQQNYKGDQLVIH